MAHPWHHAVRSAKLFGGQADDYVAIHNWFDESKAHLPDLRHRALRHHSEGIFLCERLFGVTVRNSDGREVPIRLVGEQHVKDDLGWIPTVKDWLCNLSLEPWMMRTAYKPARQEASLRSRDRSSSERQAVEAPTVTAESPDQAAPSAEAPAD